MARRKSRTLVKSERAMRDDARLREMLKHLILAEVYSHELAAKTHDKSLDIVTSYMLKCEALLLNAKSQGFMVDEVNALLEEKPEIEVWIVNDKRYMSEEEVEQYKAQAKRILGKDYWGEK